MPLDALALAEARFGNETEAQAWNMLQDCQERRVLDTMQDAAFERGRCKRRYHLIQETQCNLRVVHVHVIDDVIGQPKIGRQLRRKRCCTIPGRKIGRTPRARRLRDDGVEETASARSGCSRARGNRTASNKAM